MSLLPAISLSSSPPLKSVERSWKVLYVPRSRSSWVVFADSDVSGSQIQAVLLSSRAFSRTVPAIWNSLPHHIHIRVADSLRRFS